MQSSSRAWWILKSEAMILSARLKYLQGKLMTSYLTQTKTILNVVLTLLLFYFTTAYPPQVQHSAKGRQSNVLESQCSAVEIPEAYQCCKLRVAPEFERFTCFANGILAHISPTVFVSELNSNFALWSVVIQTYNHV